MDGFTGDAPNASEIDRLRSEVEGLRVQLDRVGHSLAQARVDAIRAMELISERMEREAKAYNYCEVFDDAVRELNEALPVGFPKLIERVSEWEVTTTYTVEIVQTVEARTEADARDVADDEFDPESFDFSDVVFHEEDQTIERRGKS